MGLGLTFLALIIIVGVISYLTTDNKYDKIPSLLVGITVAAVLSIFISIAIYSTSYYSYLELCEKKVTINQYREAINMYSKKGIREFNADVRSSSREITDLKYNNYQATVGLMIREYRRMVVLYNGEIISKRIMKDSPFFNWYIYPPPKDMEVINMTDE